MLHQERLWPEAGSVLFILLMSGGNQDDSGFNEWQGSVCKEKVVPGLNGKVGFYGSANASLSAFSEEHCHSVTHY
jgi:hypothetical protein